MYVMGGWLVWTGIDGLDCACSRAVRGLRRFGLWYGSQSKGIKKDIWAVSRTVQYSTDERWHILSKVGWVWVTTTLYILPCLRICVCVCVREKSCIFVVVKEGTRSRTQTRNEEATINETNLTEGERSALVSVCGRLRLRKHQTTGQHIAARDLLQ